MRTLDCCVMCRGVSNEVVRTCVGFSDTCITFIPLLLDSTPTADPGLLYKVLYAVPLNSLKKKHHGTQLYCTLTGMLEIPYWTDGPDPALRPISICGIAGRVPKGLVTGTGVADIIFWVGLHIRVIMITIHVSIKANSLSHPLQFFLFPFRRLFTLPMVSLDPESFYCSLR